VLARRRVLLLRMCHGEAAEGRSLSLWRKKGPVRNRGQGP